MRTDIPISQQFDAFELESKGYRDLYKLELRDAGATVLFLTPHNEITYMDQTWEYWPCQISEYAQNSTGEQSRPKFSSVNPNGVLSLWIEQGVLDGAVLTRYRVLLTDLEADVRAYSKHVWVMSKVLNLNRDLVTFELRSTLDGPNYHLPARSFYPPEFTHVSLR